METTAADPRPWPARLPISYGWINVVLASVAMTATLPGRTHGLGLITEPMLRDLKLDHLAYANLNLWSSLLGAALGLPVGWFIDRCGTRLVSVVVVTLLAMSVAWMSTVSSSPDLFTALVLVRALGQSALSVIAMAMISKWFSRRLGAAMGMFAVLLTLGFIVSVLTAGGWVQTYGWRGAWMGVAYGLMALAPIAAVLVRSTPESVGARVDDPLVTDGSEAGITLKAALHTQHFWAFLWGTSLFNLTWSAITLFNESILKEQGFSPNIAVETLGILTGSGLLANIVAGAYATRERIAKIQAVGMTMLAITLAIFPSITSLAMLRAYAVGIGLTGGVVTVVFFSAWGHLFGRAHLGQIQSAAQLGTVLASAIGPLIAAFCIWLTGTYSIMFYGLAGLTAFAAVMPLVCGPSPMASPRLTTEPPSL